MITRDDDTLVQLGTTKPTSSTLVEVLARTSLSRVQHGNRKVQDDT